MSDTYFQSGLGAGIAPLIEYVSNSGMGDVDNTTSFVTGQTGSPIPKVMYSANRSKTVQFANTILLSDRIELQVQPNISFNAWFTVSGMYVDAGSSQNISVFDQSNASGITLYSVVSSTKVIVLFAQFQDNSGTNWSGSNTSQWRVVKYSI